MFGLVAIFDERFERVFAGRVNFLPTSAASARRVRVFSERIAGKLDHDLLSKRETVALIRTYCGATDLRMRKRLLALLKDLGETR